MISVVNVSLLVLNKLAPVLAQAYVTSFIYGIYPFVYKLHPEFQPYVIIMLQG